MKGKVFISYRRASDQWALGQLRQKLVEEYGEENVFFDTHSIEGGAEWLARLDEEITHARAVVVLYCKEWFGPKEDGKRRIDEHGDMVRREIEMAHAHERVIIPVIIDSSKPPGEHDLPHALHFLLKRQFLPLQPDDLLPTRMHRLVQAIDSAQPGRLFGRRYFHQVTWLALVVTALVAAWHALGGNTSYDNAFARNALALRHTLGLKDTPASQQLQQAMAAAAPAASAATAASAPGAPPPLPAAATYGDELPELAVVDIDDAEFRTLLGGQRPLDPQVMGIALWALQAASKQANACGAANPVAINLDLAPDATSHDERFINTLNSALLALAKCRPVVLACPTSVVRRVVPDEDMKWMNQLLQAEPERLMFTHSSPDPAGLRHNESRTDIGIVAADIANGTPLSSLRNDPSRACACPSTTQDLAGCGPGLQQTGWSRSAMAVPFAQSAYTLSGALLDMPRVAARRIILIGGSFGAQPVYVVPGRSAERGAAATSSTLMQGYLLHGATRHNPLTVKPWMVLLAGAVSWLLTAVVLALGVNLQRNDDRFSRRVPAYLGLAAVMLGTPLAALAVAAVWPAWTWAAGVVAVLGVLTIGRALLACFEIVLAGGIGWRGFADLWKDVRFDLDKGSAVLKLGGAGLEALLLAVCLVIVLVE